MARNLGICFDRLISVGITTGRADCLRPAHPFNMTSPRAQLQSQLADAVALDQRFWNSPDGIIEGLDAVPSGGKVRAVYFGTKSGLNVKAYVWGSARFDLDATGPDASKLLASSSFDSVDAVIEHLRKFVRSSEDNEPPAAA